MANLLIEFFQTGGLAEKGKRAAIDRPREPADH